MRIFITIILSSFLLTNIANAKGKMIFDLKKQYFSETLIKKGEDNFNKEAKYDVGDVLVTTDTIFEDPAYMWGIFTVDLKEPLKNWNVNIKKKNGTDRTGEITAIRLTSNNGSSHFISFMAADDDKNDSIQINNKNFKIGKMQTYTYNISISSNKNKTKFFVNGQEFLKSDFKDYGLLSKVEIEISGENAKQDKLYSLDISRID